MKACLINFAPRSLLRSAYQTPPLLWLGGIIGLLLCLNEAVVCLQQTDQLTKLFITQQKTGGKLRASKVGKPTQQHSSISESQAMAVNTAIAQLNVPWNDVFDAVEQATPGTIALLSLEPDAHRHILKGNAEAQNSDAMVGYIEQLSKQDIFSHIVITRHEINQQTPSQPLRFQFEAAWKEQP